MSRATADPIWNEARPVLTEHDLALFDFLRACLSRGQLQDSNREEIRRLQARCTLPQTFWGFGITIYQPGCQRLMVVRAERPDASECIYQVLSRARSHPRFFEFNLTNCDACRIQFDFIEQPVDVVFESLADSVLGPFRFELGIDGLRILAAAQRRYVLPGDAFVYSILGMKQLASHVKQLFPDVDFSDLQFQRFRSASFVSVGKSWEPLLRGLPHVEPISPRSLSRATQAAVSWILRNGKPDGRFVYYYDSCKDSHRDHEHPQRDPVSDPYYNLLRHCGGVITLLHYFATCFDANGDRRSILGGDDAEHFHRPANGQTEDVRARILAMVRRGIEFFGSTLVNYITPGGDTAAYAFYNRKAKLGGSGIGLFMLAFYQRLLRDDRYAHWARLLARHLECQILPSGEFKYYHVYLDRLVTDKDNKSLFSFYYPGEAIIGLANYCQHVCTSAEEISRIHERLHTALHFLLIERPLQYREHYKSLPADSWLMMGINDLWDEPAFRHPLYKDFVLNDADRMVAQMYKEEDALYPDYVGSFYYQYGDHPYPDGARAEGLLAALLLAIKSQDLPARDRYFTALKRVAWSTMHLCNDERTLYSVPNPAKAMGGIRFKFTRQWFRIDTIQHVASFYLKFLPSLHELSRERRAESGELRAES